MTKAPLDPARALQEEADMCVTLRCSVRRLVCGEAQRRGCFILGGIVVLGVRSEVGAFRVDNTRAGVLRRELGGADQKREQDTGMENCRR